MEAVGNTLLVALYTIGLVSLVAHICSFIEKSNKEKWERRMALHRKAQDGESEGI